MKSEKPPPPLNKCLPFFYLFKILDLRLRKKENPNYKFDKEN